MRYDWKSNAELRNYDTMKLAVLLLAGASYVGIWQKSIRWGSEVAVPGAAAANAQAPKEMDGMDLQVEAFRDSSDVGTVRISGTHSGDTVSLMRDGLSVAEQKTPDGTYLFSLPLFDLLGGELALVGLPDAGQKKISLDQGYLREKFGVGKSATTYDVVQDPMVDSKFWLRLQGVTTSGDSVRVLLDGKDMGVIETQGGRWETQLPFENVQGKILEVGLLDSGAAVGDKKEVISAPTPEEFAAVPFRLASPGDQGKLMVGPTVFDGTAAPGTVILIYVDKFIVGKAIADPQGTWITSARIKSPGAARKVRAVTVPFRGVPATSSDTHTVNFTPMPGAATP